MRAGLPALVLLAGCAAPGPGPEQGDWPLWSLADAVEVEPNDDLPWDLGRIAPDYVLGGTSDACSSEGSWDGADVDRFVFSFDADVLVRIRLRAEGADLDFELYDPDGDLMAERDTTGVDDEVVDVGLEAGAEYGVRIRCWLGNDDRWLLAFVDRSAR